jgi:hypothetical protein
MVSMGGENTSGMYQKDRGPVIDYVDIGDRHPFTLVYDRESKTFLVGDPHELLKEKERERSERENSASKPEKAYDLNYGHMGNGLVVWNRLEEKNGDYVTVAHIDPDRHVTFHDGDMPEGVKEKILDIARTSDARISATQDIPVFNTPPIGHSPVFYGRSEENWDAYFESHRQNEECARALEKAFKEHYKNNRINIEGVLEALEGYSKERISIVLANTMRLGQSDGRFSSQNRQWQKSIRLPESALTHNTLITSHSELVNYLVTTLREREMSATPKPAIDPIRTAKDILGRGSIVTDAQPGRTYTGEMIRVGERHAVQKIAPDRGIVHNLGDIADADAMFSRGGENREVRVSYDEDGRGSANPVTKDGKRKKGISR